VDLDIFGVGDRDQITDQERKKRSWDEM